MRVRVVLERSSSTATGSWLKKTASRLFLVATRGGAFIAVSAVACTMRGKKFKHCHGQLA